MHLSIEDEIQSIKVGLKICFKILPFFVRQKYQIYRYVLAHLYSEEVLEVSR